MMMLKNLNREKMIKILRSQTDFHYFLQKYQCTAGRKIVGRNLCIFLVCKLLSAILNVVHEHVATINFYDFHPL